MYVGNTWLVPGQLMLSVYAGTVDLADLQQAMRLTSARARAEADAARPPHIISDMTARTTLDPHLLSLRAMGPLSSAYRENQCFDWIALVDPNPHPVGIALCNTLARASRLKFRLFHDVAAAIAFLQSVDPTLPPTIDTTNTPSTPIAPVSRTNV